MRNRKNKFNFKLKLFAGLILAFISFAVIATDFETGTAVTIATAAAVAAPKLTEKETEFLNVVKDEVAKKLEKFEKGYISETKFKEMLNEQMKGWVDKKPEMLDEIKDALEAQGLELRKLTNNQTNSRKTLRQQVLDQLAGKNPFEILEQRGNFKIELKAASAGTVSNESASYDLSNIGPGEAQWDREKYPESWIRQFADVGQTSYETLTYVEANVAGGADFKAQATAKSGIGLEYTVEKMSARKLTALTKFPTEMMKDIPNFMSELLNWVNDEVTKKENAAFITGTGSAPQPYGVKTLSTAMADPGAYGDFGWASNLATEYDILLLAIKQVRAYNYIPNAIIMNPADFVKMLLYKGTNVYTLTNQLMINRQNQATLMGIPIIQDTNMTATEFVLGDLKRFRIRDYEPLSIKFGYNSDDFSKNLVSVVAEKRLMTYVPTEQKKALVTGDFATVKTALAT